MQNNTDYQAIVIGASAGGFAAVSFLLEVLPVNYPIPIIIVQHRSKEDNTMLEEVLQQKAIITIKQAEEKKRITGSTVFIAPADYHLLVENDRTFSLTIDETVRYSRPSIDVLFESAAHVYKNKLVGIILTGANNDGADGIKVIHSLGGHTIAQNPDETSFPIMPAESIRTGAVRQILLLKDIREFLITITKDYEKAEKIHNPAGG